MGCSSCSSNSNGTPKGCKSNGQCATGDCDKLSVFDWLSNINLPGSQKPFHITEVRFKNGLKQFYTNPNNLQLKVGEIVAVKSSFGHDIGIVSLTGELVRIQMKQKKVAVDDPEIFPIYRIATEKDIEIWEAAKKKEPQTQQKAREIINRLGLKMKLSDVQYQGDDKKATFFYTADVRIDFRQLIKEYSSTFRVRIEMKQVGLRHEAGRLGGIGSCGRELCCATWLTDFPRVNTSAARYQQLSLNPQKLAGQCGKLKCCLNYELDSYIDALKKFPRNNVILDTESGPATFVKMDIFKKLLWYMYKNDNNKWHILTLEQVNEIIALNKKGQKSTPLEEYIDTSTEPKTDFNNVLEQDSLTRFDNIKPKRSKRQNRRKNPTNANRKRPDKKD